MPDFWLYKDPKKLFSAIRRYADTQVKISISIFCAVPQDFTAMSETMKQTDLIFLLTRYLSFSSRLRNSESSGSSGSAKPTEKKKKHKKVGVNVGFNHPKSKVMIFPLQYRYTNFPGRNPFVSQPPFGLEALYFTRKCGIPCSSSRLVSNG